MSSQSLPFVLTMRVIFTYLNSRSYPSKGLAFNNFFLQMTHWYLPNIQGLLRNIGIQNTYISVTLSQKIWLYSSLLQTLTHCIYSFLSGQGMVPQRWIDDVYRQGNILGRQRHRTSQIQYTKSEEDSFFWLRPFAVKVELVCIQRGHYLQSSLWPYGLKTLEPTVAGQLLNTFQLKSLWTILKLQTSFIQRHKCNKCAYKRANDVLNARAQGVGRKVKPQAASFLSICPIQWEPQHRRVSGTTRSLHRNKHGNCMGDNQARRCFSCFSVLSTNWPVPCVNVSCYKFVRPPTSSQRSLVVALP